MEDVDVGSMLIVPFGRRRLAAAGVGHATLRALEVRGLVRLERRERRRRPEIARVGAKARPVALTLDQASALERIERGLDDPAGVRLLLHGVTGSGKTEVYLQAVAAALERDRSAIVLVPEIALTPQTAGRFEERFGGAGAGVPSKLGAGGGYDGWRRLRPGEGRGGGGARSPVFR